MRQTAWFVGLIGILLDSSNGVLASGRGSLTQTDRQLIQSWQQRLGDLETSPGDLRQKHAQARRLHQQLQELNARHEYPLSWYTDRLARRAAHDLELLTLTPHPGLIIARPSAPKITPPARGSALFISDDFHDHEAADPYPSVPESASRPRRRLRALSPAALEHTLNTTWIPGIRRIQDHLDEMLSGVIPHDLWPPLPLPRMIHIPLEWIDTTRLRTCLSVEQFLSESPSEASCPDAQPELPAYAASLAPHKFELEEFHPPSEPLFDIPEHAIPAR